MTSLEAFPAIASCCQHSAVGKLLPNALYVHTCAIAVLDPLLQEYESRAKKLVLHHVDFDRLGLTRGEETRRQGKNFACHNFCGELLADNVEEATLVKFATDRPKISYLFYPDFDTDPHPKLCKSIIVDLISQQIDQRYYQDSDNPPILHRKETFVTPDYPLYQEFAYLTAVEATLGLLDNSRRIGTWQEWHKRLQQQGIDFEGHRLICPLDFQPRVVRIDRHKAAISRKDLSRPVRLAWEAGLFTPGSTFFDYGCGYGDDVQRIGDRGFASSGWDPYYLPDSPTVAADLVNLGYVINVIEDIKERREALIAAWNLTKRVLIVAAQVLIDDRQRGLVAYGDGIITSRNTFQKYYQQEELKAYIDQVLEVDAIAAGLGIYFVFRDRAAAEAFRASRFASTVRTPKVQAKVRNFADYQQLLTPLMEFYSQRGRLPSKGELSQEEEIRAEFGTYNRAFKLVLQATNQQEWEAITAKRRQDLLVYLALAKFGDRPSARKLSAEIKQDIKALFGTYKKACTLADQLLFSVGNLKQIAHLCQTSPIGKKLKNSLAVHVSALNQLDPLLRLYEGCASRVFGRLEDANIIKLHFHQPKITYLVYPDFDHLAHPILTTSMTVDLQSFYINYHDYADEENPPVLHQKDALVTADYPQYKQFYRLTQQEQKLGLLSDFSAIRRLQEWQNYLDKHNVYIQKHRLYKRNST